MKSVISSLQLQLVLDLAHVLPVFDIFMPKHVALMSVPLYVYDNMHTVTINECTEDEMYSTRTWHKGAVTCNNFRK